MRGRRGEKAKRKRKGDKTERDGGEDRGRRKGGIRRREGGENRGKGKRRKRWTGRGG